MSRYAIVIGKWHDEYANKLLLASKEVFAESGILEDKIDVLWVPGSFEIPIVCKTLLEKKNYLGIVTLGVLIKGETTHFDLVAREAARGVMEVSLSSGVPITFGLLTAETYEQVAKRSDESDFNKGREATIALLEVLDIKSKLAV